jgi:hypothetical protein
MYEGVQRPLELGDLGIRLISALTGPVRYERVAEGEGAL